MNKAILMGRLTKDIELKQTPTGKYVSSFTLAVPRDYVKDGEQNADFINFVAWGKTAEFCAKYLTKGTRIAVVGRIQTRTWEDQTGQKRYATEVVAESVHFADSKNDAPSETPKNTQAEGVYPEQETFYSTPDDSEIPF